MVQQLLIAVLLIASVSYLVRTVIISFRTGKTCGTGCGKCASTPQKELVNE
ncbi:MAG: FeoB-associated Cys-rich membrane protein [Bacteroidota bacterium]